MKDVSARCFKHLHVYCVLEYHSIFLLVIDDLFHFDLLRTLVGAKCFDCVIYCALDCFLF